MDETRECSGYSAVLAARKAAPDGSFWERALGLLLARKSQADGGGIHGDTVTEGLPAARYRGIVQFALRHAVVD